MKSGRGTYVCLLALICAFLCAVGGCKRKGEHRVNQHRIDDSKRQVLGPGPVLRAFRVVPSTGTCAPKADNVATFGSCCNNSPCTGQCVLAENARVECACYDVKGGCAAGLVCSKIRRGCVKPQDAQLP
jgi:hypothetical protein